MQNFTLYTLHLKSPQFAYPEVSLYCKFLLIWILLAFSRARGGVSVAYSDVFAFMHFRGVEKDNGILYEINVIVSSSV